MQLPDVVRVVLQHVHAENSSAASLAAAVRVNRTWFACGVDLLWRAPPLSSALDVVAATAPATRVAFYAHFIVACERIPAAALAAGLPLRRLRRLGLHGAWLDDEAAADAGLARILPYVRPTLEHLRSDLRPALLARLAALPLRALRSLHVDLCGGGVGGGDSGGGRARFDALVDWLAQQPLLPLESLRIEGGPPFGDEAAATERAMGLLARLPGLRLPDLVRRHRRQCDIPPGATAPRVIAVNASAGRGSFMHLGRSRCVSVDLLNTDGLALSSLLPRVEVLYLDQGRRFGLHRVA
jgi:hypothetical protein